ncbi:hypothetical protein P7K49_025514 [Saguinus oedipus]|uniref:Uncharacterized protein n=1 Tax=Saguinus oedipus TaxID=9490 RepID=A0ABQ9UI98_SAGOE|nr:hypothetical protein P7K49_025514 [Saguinus oedipus]
MSQKAVSPLAWAPEKNLENLLLPEAELQPTCKIQRIDSTGLEERGPCRLTSALEAPRQNFQCQKVISRAILAHKHAHEG